MMREEFKDKVVAINNQIISLLQELADNSVFHEFHFVYEDTEYNIFNADDSQGDGCYYVQKRKVGDCCWSEVIDIDMMECGMLISLYEKCIISVLNI